MSYILDALRKAEQERALGQAPDLRAFANPAVPSRRRLWPWGLALALLVNGAVLALLIWPDRESADDLPPPGSLDRPILPEQDPAPGSGPSGPPQQRGVAAVPLTPAAPPSAAPQTPPAAPLSSPPPEPPGSAAEPTPPEPRISQSTPAVQPEPSPQPPNALTDVQTKVQIETAPAAERPPVLRALSESFRRSLPALNLDVHVYGERPEHRFVMINGRRYSEGDWLREGPLLETITVDGAILRYQEQRFMLEVPR